jgi:hypothetical protein
LKCEVGEITTFSPADLPPPSTTCIHISAHMTRAIIILLISRAASAGQMRTGKSGRSIEGSPGLKSVNSALDSMVALPQQMQQWFQQMPQQQLLQQQRQQTATTTATTIGFAVAATTPASYAAAAADKC